MATNEELKRAAAFHAARWIEDGMVVGLGTGSTVRYLLDSIADARRGGQLLSVIGIPTSEDTRRKSLELGIPLSTLRDHPMVDLTLDGADEFDPNLDLIKGLGGALLREKLIAVASKRVVILADASKRVHHLGERAPLPVEIDPFGLGIQVPFLRELSAKPRLRKGPSGEPFVTDGGNFILDCDFGGRILDPRDVAATLDSRPGIMEHGLFLDLATDVVVAGQDGVQVLRREPESPR
ncbi:MAG: ribose 5-phosphate isomerase A [Gemmatimonas sp.]|nr:ribose 5-phosphate isomerase A [Gemmatimonas sp.]